MGTITMAGKKFRVRFKKFTLETNSLKCHYQNVRVAAAINYAIPHGLIAAAKKYKYVNIDSLRRAAIGKLGEHYPFSTKVKISDEILEKAITMRKTMTVKAIADHFGVSQTHIGKKISDAKQNSNCDKILQQILCGRL